MTGHGDSIGTVCNPPPKIAFLPDSANCHRPDAAGIGFRGVGKNLR